MAVFDFLRRLASEEQVPVYLVGGPVRDAVLDVPVNDLDFVLVGNAPFLATEIANRLGGEVTVHPRFGTATVVIEGDHVDIVTARKETYPYPGSLPETSPSDLSDDLARRDFSINAMALPLAGESPQVIDPHGGLQDLADRLITVLHNASFSDDPTRMLRAVRYGKRLGFQLSVTTMFALGQSIEEGHVSAVSGDRWRQEFQKIFSEHRASEMLLRAIDLGILAAIHPALIKRDGLNRLVGKSGLTPIDYLSALVFDITAADGDSVSGRLNLTSDWARVVRDTIALQGLSDSLSTPTVKTSEICRWLDGLDPEAIRASARFIGDLEVSARLGQYLDEWRHISPSLTGDDLLAMGVPPGIIVGDVLRELHSAVLDGLVDGETEERTLVEQILSRGS